MENLTVNTAAKVKTFLPIFNGFYGSIWEDYLTSDGEAEHYKLDDDFDFYQYVDYNKYFNHLSKQFCNIVENELKEFVYSIEFEELVSPKFYNFSNDSINCTIKPNTLEIRNYIFSNLERFREYLKDNYTSRDGFNSFHSNDFDEWIILTDNFRDLSHDTYHLGAILNFIAQNEGITEGCLEYGAIDTHISEFYTDEFYKLVD
jgi:hypothetical protein